jgi:endonuclease/exonuclease/phosphatase family metal-dependent hydrolase
MPDDNDEKIKQSKNILKRMKFAYTQRASQVEMISEHIRKSQNPHFIIGDFNDPPVSYSYGTLKKGLRDAFVENGFGMGKTYIGIMPNFRIDYILYPTTFNGQFYNAYKLSSDHSMIETAIKFSEN